MQAFLGGAEASDKISYESWAEGLGVTSYSKKKKKEEVPKITKAEEIKKAEKTLDYIFGFGGTFEKQNLKADFNTVTKLSN